MFKSCLSNTWVMRNHPFSCTTSGTKCNKTVGTHEASEYKKETAFFWFPGAPLLPPFHHFLGWAVCSGEGVTGKATGLSVILCVCVMQQSPHNLCTQHKTQNYPQVWCFPLLLLQICCIKKYSYGCVLDPSKEALIIF